LQYICFDSFDQVTGGPEFVRATFPKVVQLVGNPGWNSNNSYTLGSSEGGYKINLWYVNHLGEQFYDSNWQAHDVITDRQQLNDTYFHTILHEYGHVFHQRVPYTNEFNQITGTEYLGGSYTSVFSGPDDPQIFALGFVTAYSAYTADEDFAEVFSTYVTSTQEEFDDILLHASSEGRGKIQRKLRIVRDYFMENWDLDIDALRDAIQAREAKLTEQDFDDISL
jgi:substrate import-associated zinc metallohydrolase lipoprotein